MLAEKNHVSTRSEQRGVSSSYPSWCSTSSERGPGARYRMDRTHVTPRLVQVQRADQRARRPSAWVNSWSGSWTHTVYLGGVLLHVTVLEKGLYQTIIIHCYREWDIPNIWTRVSPPKEVFMIPRDGGSLCCQTLIFF